MVGYVQAFTYKHVESSSVINRPFPHPLADRRKMASNRVVGNEYRKDARVPPVRCVSALQRKRAPCQPSPASQSLFFLCGRRRTRPGQLAARGKDRVRGEPKKMSSRSSEPKKKKKMRSGEKGKMKRESTKRAQTRVVHHRESLCRNVKPPQNV